MTFKIRVTNCGWIIYSIYIIYSIHLYNFVYSEKQKYIFVVPHCPPACSSFLPMLISVNLLCIFFHPLHSLFCRLPIGNLQVLTVVTVVTCTRNCLSTEVTINCQSILLKINKPLLHLENSCLFELSVCVVITAVCEDNILSTTLHRSADNIKWYLKHCHFLVNLTLWDCIHIGLLDPVFRMGPHYYKSQIINLIDITMLVGINSLLWRLLNTKPAPSSFQQLIKCM